MHIYISRELFLLNVQYFNASLYALAEIWVCDKIFDEFGASLIFLARQNKGPLRLCIVLQSISNCDCACFIRSALGVVSGS